MIWRALQPRSIRMTEAWKPVTGWPYQVSDMGRVRRSRPSRGTSVGKILKPAVNEHGYECVVFSSNGKRRTFRVHRLVGRAFLGPCPEGLETNHKNADKTDNRAENLEYVTSSENTQHALRSGLFSAQPRGIEKSQARLTDERVLKIRHWYAAGDISQKTLAVEFGVSQQLVSLIVRRKKWAHLS